MHNGGNHNNETAAGDLARILAADGLTGGFIKDSQAGSLPATQTNDNATAGTVGELIESTVLVGAAVALSNGARANITSISLTAGDWDVWGNIIAVAASGTIFSSVSGWVHTVSATFPTIPNGGAYASIPVTLPATATLAIPVGCRRYSLASTTTIYLTANTDFSVSTASAYGYIGARRVR